VLAPGPPPAQFNGNQEGPPVRGRGPNLSCPRNGKRKARPADAVDMRWHRVRSGARLVAGSTGRLSGKAPRVRSSDSPDTGQQADPSPGDASIPHAAAGKRPSAAAL